ncbi:MAG: ABC transporter ATP-binding protein [candidate division Zixibacteria bacterium]|nr:ABC transporter ATP-binding protein [candidate division Zixibacteria bacterium]
MKVTLDNVSKSFPGRKVFENISLEIDKGKTLVITGANGSGKTTLIKIICALLTPTSGKVIFNHNNHDLTGAEILKYAGYAAPDLFLYDELTAAENIDFFARVSGIDNPDIKSAMAKYGLSGRENDMVGSYSSGMKQRLKYILALLKKPPLLLLDEPTANLDEQGRAIVDDVIKNHEGITVIATNEKNELKYADETIRLGE